MGYNIGSERSAGIGKEVSYGTPVAPAVWLPWQEFSLSDRKVTLTDTSSVGTRDTNLGSETDHVLSGGNLNGLMYANYFPHVALAGLGAIATEAHDTATGVKVHTISPGATLPSYTIGGKDKNADVRFAGALLEQLVISSQVGAYNSFTSSWLGRKSASAENTPSLTDALVRFRPKDTKIRYAASTAGLTGAEFKPYFQGFSFTLTNGIQTVASLGTENPDFVAGSIAMNLALTRSYFNTEFKALVFGDVPQAVELKMVREDIVIGTHETPSNNTHPSISLIFEPGFFSEWQQEGGMNDVMSEQMAFQPVRSFSTSQAMKIVVTDTEESY